MAANRLYSHFGHLLLAACFTVTGLLAAEHHGIVKSGGLPVPGATITATQGDKKVVTTTDDAGFYSFPELADGIWTISVDMLGFAKTTRDVGVAEDAPSPMWDLKYETLEAITAPPPTPAPAATPPAAFRSRGRLRCLAWASEQAVCCCASSDRSASPTAAASGPISR